MLKHSITRSWVIAALIVSAVACGSAEEPTGGAPRQEAAGDLAAFCDAAKELDEAAFSDEGPDDSQLDRLVDNTPPEIRDEAEILVASAREFRSGNDEAASSDEIQAAGDRLDDYFKNNCKDV